MPCKKSALISAIGSYAAARSTNDGNLISFSADLINALLETLEFAPEEDQKEQTEEAIEESPAKKK